MTAATPPRPPKAPAAAGDGRPNARAAAPLPVLLGSVPDAFTVGVSPAEDRTGHALLARCVAAGIDAFDCGPAGGAAQAEEFFSGVFGGVASPPHVCSTLTGEPTGPPVLSAHPERTGRTPDEAASPFGPDPRLWPNEARAAIARSARRLQRAGLSLAWLEAGALPAIRDPAVRRALDETGEAGTPREGWGVRFETAPPDRETLEGLLALGVRHFAFPVHLLNAALALPAIELVQAARGAVVGLDVHAGGRLNGLRFQGALGRPSHGPPRVVDFATLRAELAPVTELGFLTRDRARTLGQAAIQFALGIPGVLAVVVPIADPSRLPEWTAWNERPGLTPEDRRRVAELSGH